MRTIDETDLKKSLKHYPLAMSKATIERFNETFPDTPIEGKVERVLVLLDDIGRTKKYIELQPREVSEDESHIKDLMQDMRAGIRYHVEPMLVVEDTSDPQLYEELILAQGNHRISPYHSLGYIMAVVDKIPMNMKKHMLGFKRLTNFLNDFGPQKSMKIQDTVKSYLQDIEDRVMLWTSVADCTNEIRRRRPSCDPTSIDKIVNSIEKQLGTYQSGLFRSLGTQSRKRARFEAGLPEDVVVAPSKYLDKYINDLVLKEASGHDRKERLVIAINADKALTKKQLEKKRKSAYDKVLQVYAYHDAVFKKTAKGKTKELTKLDLYPLTVNENHPLHRVIITGFLAQFNTEDIQRVIRTNEKGQTIETLSGMQAYNADTMIPIAKDTKNVGFNVLFDIEDEENE